VTRSRRLTWIVFALCVLLVLDVLAWVSVQTLRLERMEHEARTRAQLNERVRLALWRMDSAIAPIVAAEAARPPQHYRAFFDPTHELDARPDDGGGALRASPLLLALPRLIRLHYEVRPDGSISSPQVPEGPLAELAIREGLTTPQAITRARLRLIELEQMLTSKTDKAADTRRTGVPEKAEHGEVAVMEDFDARRKVFEEAVSVAEPSPTTAPGDDDEPQDSARRTHADRSPIRTAGLQPQATQTLFAPRWAGSASSEAPELVFERTVQVGSASVVQGFWVDWPALRAELLSRIVDLLPQADLVPAPAGGQRLLAAIPASLVPSNLPAPPAPLLTPARQTLLVSWFAVLVAIGAIALVLRASMRLSERRGRFVAAVTHELRTPLTTFHLYSDLLGSEGLDEEQRRGYLARLQEQTTRLSRIVESVLTYARLDRRRLAVAPAQVRDIIERIHGSQPDSIEIKASSEVLDGRVLCDIDGVERILLNLIDNARKYAPGTPVSLEIRADARTIAVRVRDRGQGIDAEDARRIFVAFERGEHAGDSDAPGLGLGLSLARELARAMGGDLCLVPVEGPGACFELTLRRAR